MKTKYPKMSKKRLRELTSRAINFGYNYPDELLRGVSSDLFLRVFSDVKIYELEELTEKMNEFSKFHYERISQ